MCRSYRQDEREPQESWADLANDLRKLTIKAYPDLDEPATDKLALTHYLMAINDIQLSLSVKQKVPSSLDEAVSHTLQVEAFLAAS